MNFKDKLNYYMNDLNCSISSLSKVSKLSESTISRYKNGDRIPNNPSLQLDKLINGLSILYSKKKNSDIDENIIRNDFNKIIISYDINKIINNFNNLVISLRINISDFSKIAGYDPSYLSKIRSGERKPANPNVLLNAICNYIVREYNDSESKNILINLMNCSHNEISDINNFRDKLYNWLCSDYKEIKHDNNVCTFLSKLNDFDLNEYIKAIKFDKLKVPTSFFKIPKSKNYYGLEEMKDGELDFLKATVLSKNTKDVFMCSDMQIDDLAKDLDFGKKWMFGIAMMLKKGIHLNFIHNLDRPFNEMMLGLESWIPIYMTGQVTPYYFPNTNNNVYSHLNYVSDSVILTGECIKGYHNKGKYYLTNNKNEIEYYKSKANLLLKKAKPLMNIFTDKDSDLFNRFIKSNYFCNNEIKIINSSIPIYTISDKLLLKILKRNNISKNDSDKILNYVSERKKYIADLLINNKIIDIIGDIDRCEFDKYPFTLDLSNLFYDKNITYTYEDYLEHLNTTKEYSKLYNYSFILNKNMTFRNIKISIVINKFVVISKNNNPTIHFVIEHPKLCSAIDNFIVPITEK